VRRVLLAILAAAPLVGCVLAPRVQTPPNEPQAARLEADFVALSDGARLPLRAWLPAAGAAPRAAVVAVHGLDDHAGSFDDTARRLAARGFAVYAFDQRGFGGAPQRGIWAGGDRLADDVHEVAVLLHARHAGVPLYGLGESMGGAVLLRALHRHPSGWLDGAALLAPAVWNRGAMAWYVRGAMRLLAHSWRRMKLSGRITGRRPTDDEDALRRLHEDPLVIHRVRVDVLWGVAELMDAVVAEPAPAVPLLILYGAHDEIVPPQPMCAWTRDLRPRASWQLAFYPDGWHLLTRDRIAAKVQDDLAAWLEAPGSALPSGADRDDPVGRLCALAAR
jgi:alpha-beta hydrolase superfamily lysophospholipase